MPITNFSNPRCYAKELCDCSDKLSREHHVSASVLKLLGEEHTISNASWLPPGRHSPPIPVGSLGSKILCERHNRFLSPLDASAKVVFKGLLQALWGPPRGPSPQRVGADGDKLELWLLKACCGALASGSLIEGGNVLPREVPRAWLNVLFSGAPWAEGAGLHVRQASMKPYRGYAIGLARMAGALVGGGIEFAGVQLFVLLERGAEKRITEQSTGQVNRLIYRPGAIRIESPNRVAEIELEWRTWIPSEAVLYRHEGRSRAMERSQPGQ